MTSDTLDASWSLEVVRGRKPGQIFPLLGPNIVLGTAPTPPTAGIDLAGQEGATTRRMAAQHAILATSGQGLEIRDLDSPSGTFVNRRRVLPGQACPLRAGDEIQLGSIVLRVTCPKASRTNRLETTPEDTFAYAIDDGPTCRNWDDFLVASAQRWDSLRDDLGTGRLDAWLAEIGRDDLRPRSASGASADDRLDAWLASLPTTRPSRPELDVHPARIVVRATPGGGAVRKTAKVSNVGHRLLRSSARVEPLGLDWLRLAPEFADVPFSTVEVTDLAFEVILPPMLAVALAGEIVVEGNGGTRRIAVVLEPRDDSPEMIEPTPVAVGPSPVVAWLTSRSSKVGITTAAASFAALRLIIAVVGGQFGPGGGAGGPGLGGVVLMMAAAGSLIGAGLATRREGLREAFPGGFAGGCVGALAAAVTVSACRSIESTILGGWSTSILADCGLWAVVGAGISLLMSYSAKGRS